MKKRGAKGFTLVELLVAISLGLLVTGAAVAIYKKALDNTSYLTQRTTVQANVRTGINQIAQDLNSAGYGLPLGGVTVPAVAIFSCTTGSATWQYNCPTTMPSFPQVSTSPSVYKLTGIMPMYQLGASVNGNNTDQITMAYVDSSPNFVDNTCGDTTVCGFDAYPLTQAAVSGSTTTLTFNGATNPAPNDEKWGFKIGDLVLVSNPNGQAVGEVTSVSATAIVLGASDPMKLNQAYTTGGSVPIILGFGSGSRSYGGTGTLTPTTVQRLYLVTYYVATNPLAQAAGTTANPTRLYRMVNGSSASYPPVPVAEQISNLNFSYNLFSTCGTTPQQVIPNPTVGQYTLIKSVSTTVWAASTLNTNAVPGQRIQQIPMTTTVSPRNLSYFDSYATTNTSGC